MISIAVIAVIVVLWICRMHRREINEIKTKVDAYALAQAKHMVDLNAVIQTQSKYIKTLQDERSHTKERVDELVSLLPEAGPINFWTFPPETDSDRAAIVMFEKMEIARKIVEKHPDGALYKELKELLK
jgi:hypothetical protein